MPALPFAKASAAHQTALLTALSTNKAPSAAEQRGVDFFKAIKSLTITGYYTSEVGMREEMGDDGNMFFLEFKGCTHPEHKARSTRSTGSILAGPGPPGTRSGLAGFAMAMPNAPAQGRRVTVDLILAVLVGLAALALYVCTMLPGLGGPEDTPKFQLLGTVLGTAHSPGYPLYVLVAHAFSRLPVATPAWRANFMSACFGAVTVGVLYLIIRRAGASRLGADCSGAGRGRRTVLLVGLDRR